MSANGTWLASDVYRASDWTTLLYPQEPPLPTDGPAASLRIDYPRACGEFAGLSCASWIFFGSSMHIWLMALVVLNTGSLLIDTADVVRYLRGERKPYLTIDRD